MGFPGLLSHDFERRMLYLQELPSFSVGHAFRCWEQEPVSTKIHSLLGEGTL